MPGEVKKMRPRYIIDSTFNVTYNLYNYNNVAA